MDIEKSFNEVLDEGKREKTDAFLKNLSKQWLYFFFNEKKHKESLVSAESNVVEVVFVNKDNPITVPIIDNEHGKNGVLYINMELAKKSAKFTCKIAKMECDKAFKFFYDRHDIDGVYLRGDCGTILLQREDIKKLILKK